MAGLHEKISIALDLPIYLCDSHSPWQRPCNASNRLLREYVAKASDLSVHTLDDLADVAACLNTRSHKVLDWKRPAAVLVMLVET